MGVWAVTLPVQLWALRRERHRYLKRAATPDEGMVPNVRSPGRRALWELET